MHRVVIWYSAHHVSVGHYFVAENLQAGCCMGCHGVLVSNWRRNNEKTINVRTFSRIMRNIIE